jgi:hypothetical protein
LAKLKVIFHTVYRKKKAKLGHGIWFFDAAIDGAQVGDHATLLAVRKQSDISLSWKKEIEVAAKNNVTVDFKVKDNFDSSEIGSLQIKLAWPWKQQDHSLAVSANFILEYSVELEVQGKFGQHATDTVFAARASATAGAIDVATVAAKTFLARMEWHECRPTPPLATGTDRPAFPPAAAKAVFNSSATKEIKASHPINVVPNPPVIPVLTAETATRDNVARIEFTFYRPSTLALTDNDSRLEWSVVNLSGTPSITFFGPKTGLKVRVYGTARGEVQFQIKFKGTVIGLYRALVEPVKRIFYRANILNGPTAASQPRAGPASIQDHIKVANRFLRPLAVELSPDVRLATKFFPSKTSAVSTTGTMMLEVGANKHRFSPAPNDLNGLVSGVNGLKAGVTAAIDTQGVQHRVVLTYNGNPAIAVIDDPSGVNKDVTHSMYQKPADPVATTGKMRLSVGKHDRDFTLTAKGSHPNNLTGLRDAINAAKADVLATIASESPSKRRVVLEPQTPSSIQLVDDPGGANTKLTSAITSNGALETPVLGVFRISVPAGQTRNVSGTFPPGTALNFAPGVFNFAYIHSGTASVLGSAIDRDSNIGANLTDNGTPSSSWIKPSGVAPHAAAGVVTMNVRPPRQRTPAVAGLYSMWVGTDTASPTKAGMKYGNTIAHELGHVLHLGHRSNPAGSVDDGVNHPPDENIMHPSNPESIAQDFDILQARAVRNSPLLK